MTEPKPSGLRPPSKIGRPCSTMPPRPAVPPSPPRPSMNQMDHLWETHGRRLSEAGLRRGSDTSVVLTQDTDSFIIGDRVWVGGTKPGAIAYIGETQFAPGDWAGVVLDEPIGKNDGSVAGCRYFQCEPKRGIFSRLTRLTRHPLADLSLSPTQKTPTTPPDSTRGSLSKSMSPSLNASTTSLSSTVSQRDLRLGERVIVSSSQGSKTGVLRYLGNTDFAPGEWCGVELDDPIGKNDGSVDGKRYFECRARYGLFAPAHKVSRSPSSKRTSCVVHRPIGASLNSTLKKAGSRESIVSVSSIASTTASTRTGFGTARRPGMRTSTPARTTLQETLKEKQQEIEILRKERDLERDRVTKAASQADQAEQSAISIKQEYEKYREEMQKTVTEAESALTKLLEEKNALALQLEEEKRKCEDLLFRFEEESVNKDDIQKERSEQSVINTVNENRIRDLEKQLLEERERVAQLERDSVKLFETEEELTRLRNEVSSTAAQENAQLQDLQNRNKSLEEAKNALEKEMQGMSALVDLRALDYTERIKELEARLNEKQEESTMQKESETSLQKELEMTRQSLQEKCTLIENMRKEFESNTNTLREELQRSKDAIECIKKERESERELLVSKYEKIVDEKENLVKVKAQALEIESQKQLEMQNVALEGLKAENIKQINELSESFNQQLMIKETKIKDVSLQLDQKISEIEKLMSELSLQIGLSKKKEEELSIALQKVDELNARLKSSEEKNSTFSRQIQDYQTKSEDSFKIIQEKQRLEEDIASLKETGTQTNAQLVKLCEALKVKDKELSELRASTAAQIEELTKRFQHQLEEKSKYIEEVNADVSHKSLLLTKLEQDIIELKSVIATKDEEIKNLLEKTSELQDALTLSEQTKTNLESELRSFESKVENLTQQVAGAENKISQLSTQKEKLESDIANLVSSTADSSEQLVKYNEDLRNKEKELDELKDKSFKSENTLKLTEGKLNTLEQEFNKVNTLVQEQRSEIEDFKSQLEKERKSNTEASNKVQQYETQNSELLKKIEDYEHVKESFKQKTQEVLDLTNQLKTSKDEVLGLRGQHDAGQKSHEEEVSSLRKQMDDLKTEVDASKEEAKVLQKAKVKLEADQSANRWTIEELTDKLTAETEHRAKFESSISEKDCRIQQVESKLAELQKANETLLASKDDVTKDLTVSLNTMTKEVEELRTNFSAATEATKAKEVAFLQLKEESEKTEAEVSKLNGIITALKEEQTNGATEMTKVQGVLSAKTKEISDVTERNTSLENSVKELESQLRASSDEIVAKNNLLREMEGTLKELKNSKDESVTKLQNSLESEVKAKQAELEAVSKQNSELEKKHQLLQDTVKAKNNDMTTKDATIQKLTAQIKALEDAQTEKVKANQQMKNEELKSMQSALDDMSKQKENLAQAKESLEKLMKEKQEKIEVLTNTMKNKEKEAEKNTQNLMEKLNVISSESAQLREVQSSLEKENKQITAKWTEATNQLKLTRENMKNNYDAAGGDMKQNIVNKDIDLIKLQEENETAKGQIDFLNSVIVDMQRKNEALLCKVEVLEMGVPANEADDYTRNTLEKRMAAPRMFCDICDQFDLHETEDCPRQAQDFLESEKVAKSPKKVSVERPYCENCEMFGHDTRDCDDAETF